MYMENYKVYALIDKNKPGDIRYIGLTRQTLKQRCSKHKTEKCNPHKLNWIKKIGIDNLEVILLLDNLSLEEACNKEIELISEYKKMGYNLTNITNGGEGWLNYNFSDTHKENISRNHADVSGKNNPMYGKAHTQESIDKIKLTKKLSPHKYTDTQIETLKRVRKGEGNSQAILTEDKVLEIRKLSSQGIQNYILAKDFNMKVSAIWKIVNRYTWKHI